VKIGHIEEPELEFGSGRHIDIRFGITNYGPHDVAAEAEPRRIRVGIVGTPEDVERTREWLERCRDEIAGAASRQANLRPRFPGFRAGEAFHASLVLDDSLCRTIQPRVFEDLWKAGDANRLVTEAAGEYVSAFDLIAEESRVDVLICAVPQALENLRAPELRLPIPAGEPRLDFHDLLKARAMAMATPVPVQLMVSSTADPSRARKSKTKKASRSIQDDATRAWNLHCALYYKAGGRPWRVPRDTRELTTCYVGVSFYYDLERARMLTSMAQVFDERGDGVVVRGGQAEISKSDRTPHLSAGDAEALLRDALTRYRRTHETLPARVVLHKTSSFSGAELEGFRSAAAAERVSRLDAVSVTAKDAPHLFRYGAYPPLRGTWLALDDSECLLYTRGSVDFYATYPGMYVPQPLLFRCEDVEAAPKQIAKEMLALSKLNWNHTQFDGSDPITIVAARKVGDILKYVDDDRRIAARYAFYM
jgi:hypothetical protein